MRRALLPLVPLYAVATEAKNIVWERGWLQAERLRGAVVSVGNLSVGGSGKTPLTIRLAELLRERGLAVDVLSRGYGRRSKTVERVDPDGGAGKFGDEPLLMARAGIPVYVGADRAAAGRLAECESAGARVHLLDDGLQHRRLRRDVDVVVLHRSDFGEARLPAGRLREGFGALGRAHFVAMREEDGELEPELRRRGCALPIWWMTRRVSLPEARRVAAFCAIARPEEFFAELRRQGRELVAARAWRDHHVHTEADIRELCRLAGQRGVEALVTTEKDWVRLDPRHRRMLEDAAPLRTARLTVRLRDEAEAMDGLLAKLTKGGGGVAP